MQMEWIGWVATAAFAASYLFKEPRTLRMVQAGAALLWVSYGVLIHALPVVVANVVVAGVAAASLWRRPSARAASAPARRSAAEVGQFGEFDDAAVAHEREAG